MMLPPQVSRSTMAAQRRESVKILDQTEELSLTAIATAACPSRSVRTSKSSSDPLVEFHVAVLVDLAVALTQCGQAQQPVGCQKSACL